MGLFQHPHLTRGIVHTAKGGFAISRGLVELPDDIGESYGWQRVDGDDDGPQVAMSGPAMRGSSTTTMRPAGSKSGGSHEPYSS